MTAAQDKQIWRKLSAKVSIRSPPPSPTVKGLMMIMMKANTNQIKLYA